MDEQILYSLAESLQSVPSSFRCSDGPRVCLRGRLPVGACALQAPDPWGLSSLSATIFVFSGPKGRHLHTSVWVPGRVTIQHCSPRTKVFPEMGTWELPVLGQLFSLCRCARCCWRVVASEPYKRACVRAHTHTRPYLFRHPVCKSGRILLVSVLCPHFQCRAPGATGPPRSVTAFS